LQRVSLCASRQWHLLAGDHVTRRYIRAGIAGFHIEDEINPKHSTWANGLIAIADMQVRIDACKRAREGSDLVIIARWDEMYLNSQRDGGSGSIEEAKRRGAGLCGSGRDADSLVHPGVRFFRHRFHLEHRLGLRLASP